MEPVQKTVAVNGITINYFEHNEHLKDALTLLFVHATGFHGRVWDQIIARLPSCHAIAIDQRGHGRSSKVKIERWQQCIDDVKGVLHSLNLNNVVGIGHSMGAHALVGAMAENEDRMRSLVAIDPVIAAEELYESTDVDVALSHEHPMAKRRSTFDSPEDMKEWLINKGSYGLFDPAMLEDYCRHGLLPLDGGGYQLACPPEIEASVYMTSRSHRGIYDAIRAITRPVTILRAKLPDPDAEMDFSSSPTWPGLVDMLKQGKEHFYADKTHFLPMEVPDEVAARIAEHM